MVKDRIVYAGMSGGVDSSVAAALLLREGYKVVGVYMKNWTDDIGGFTCPWQRDYDDALKVAVKLGIELKVFDFQKEYRQLVVNYMLSEYQKGRTPNPDIMCNQEVKFKLFLEASIKEGASFIATGHYARIVNNQLHKAIDKKKDQSYFLYRISSRALQKSLFPIGDYQKTEVRKIASKMGLATANKKDSQGICFVGDVSIKEFLISQLGPQKPGPIINQKGQVIGEHDGAIFYTIGQRHGLNIGGGLPYYVTKKDIPKNSVYVTTDLNDANLWKSLIEFNNLHFSSIKPLKSKDYDIKLRYGSLPIKGKINDSLITLNEPIKAISSGQSAVIYDDDLVLGGGIIV